MAQLELFETASPAQKTARVSRRIVIIDHHIIAQYRDGAGRTGWWSLYKGHSNTEEDYALWEETEVNMRRAVKLAGDDAPIIRSDLAPVQSRGGWLAEVIDKSVEPNTPEGYRMALRELARRIA